ncbi:protein kinase [Actinoplanes sp. NPDC048967]|uniref:serine/threonine-protein kinase n=1 Tax=Actinoplanes sp. NPDC048967 TaxID=3155269 RepID=UPI00340C5BDF
MDQDPTSSGVRPDSDGASTLDLSGRCVGSSYILVRPIGQGATGTVWRGVDRASGEPVAVKLLHESLLRQPKLVTRFVQERTILLMLRHRNVVRVRDLFSVGESLGLVMDLVPGGSLREYLREQHTLKPGEAARLAAQVAAALAEAHELGIIHRDLKPDNILLHRTDGELDTRLTDFGIARVLNTPSLTTTHAVVGTPHYMAPEAFHSATVSPAADIYALGVLLYEMVCGRPPYDSDTVHDLMRLHLEGHPQRLPGIPDPLWQIITGCLEQKPRLRPTAGELIAELSAVARAAGDAPALPRPERPAAEPVSSRLVLAADESASSRSARAADESALARAGDESASPRPAPGGDERKPRAGEERKPRAAGPEVPKPVHPSLAGVRLPVPRRRNQPASWRWGRPWATIAVVSAAMLASGVATTAWHLVRTPGQQAGAATAEPMLPAGRPSGPVAASRSAPAARTSASHEPVAQRRRPTSAAVAAQALTPARPAATRRTTPKPRVKEAQPYGPYTCKREFGMAGFTPLVVSPCHALGSRVRIQALLTAPTPGEGRIAVALQDLSSGRTVGTPKVCTGLTFTKAQPTRVCGPLTIEPVKGRRYQVIMSWTFGESRYGGAKVARGSAFDW